MKQLRLEFFKFYGTINLKFSKNEVHMRKNITSLLLSLGLLASVFTPISFVHATDATPTASVNKNYLFTGKNYYQDANIQKGFLDQEINETTVGGTAIWEAFQRAVAAGHVTYTPGMTFNQYYLANNIALEDNYRYRVIRGGEATQRKLLKDGVWLNSEPRTDDPNVNYVTYVGPTRDSGTWWGDKNLSGPRLFSRLSVGHLPQRQEPYAEVESLAYYSREGHLFPNRIGYGEASTVNDYMLIPENNIIIPTRYNTLRNDVYLTMRSVGKYSLNIPGAQAYLNVKDHKGQDVQSSVENPKAYLTTTSNVFVTPVGLDQMGGWTRYLVPGLYPRQSQDTLTNIGVNDFHTSLNAGLALVLNYSDANTIPSGHGGQIQLTGFYRQSDIDNAYLTAEADRVSDAEVVWNAKYYMYYDDTIVTDRDVKLTPSVATASNGKPLYSPNETSYKIETTRPFFKNYGDLAVEIALDQSGQTYSDIFDQKLDVASFEIEDLGYEPNGAPIQVDESRVRVRISEDGGANYTATKYTLAELKAELALAKYSDKSLTLAYTYFAPDADKVGTVDEAGLLPHEIADNEGAYAVPIVRKVKMTKVPEGRVIIIPNDPNPTEPTLPSSTERDIVPNTAVAQTEYLPLFVFLAFALFASSLWFIKKEHK